MPIEEREAAIDLSEKYEEAWIVYLTEFDEKIWPIFKRHGYTKDAALLMWRMQAIYDAVDEMAHPPTETF